MKTAFSGIVGGGQRTIARITYLGVGLCLGHSLAVIKSARTTPSGEIASPTKTSTVDSISTPNHGQCQTRLAYLGQLGNII